MFSLCDYAQDCNGKMVIINPFDHYYFPQLPVTVANLHFVLRLRVRPSDGNAIPISINLIDPEGNSVFQEIPEFTANVQVLPGYESYAFAIPASLHNVVFKNYGRYSLGDCPFSS